MAFAYLVEDTKTKKRRLIEAGSPANAIAFCAKGMFTAQRVEGAVLDTLKSAMEMEQVSPPKEDAGKAGDEGKSGE